jgi:gluconolactonase
MSTAKVIAEGLSFPEGPSFDSQSGLWCVELKGEALVNFTDGGLERIRCGGAPNGSAVDARGRVWFCDSGSMAVRLYDPAADGFETVIDSVGRRPLDKPNDLAFDARGNLLFTCPGDSRTEPTGYVCCWHPEHGCRIIAEALYFPNGLALLDAETLVLAETYRQRLWIGQWDAASRQWQEPQVLTEVGGPTGPDGMAVGADGLIYVAVFGTGTVKAVDRRGVIQAVYPLPGSKPTNLAFDPSGRLGLVVTEAEAGRLLSLPDLGSGQALFNGEVE